MGRIFRRYKSTIYGNYRKSYLIAGAMTGAAMAVITLIRDMMAQAPMAQPDNFISEIVMGVGIFWATYQYRKQLPDGKVMLKELMLLGLGIGVVCSLVYGLWIWFNCSLVNSSLVDFYNQQRLAQMPPATESPEAKMAAETVMKYTAGDWGFIGGFRSAVMSIIITFFSALIFRTEKSPVVVKGDKNQESKEK